MDFVIATIIWRMEVFAINGKAFYVFHSDILEQPCCQGEQLNLRHWLFTETLRINTFTIHSSISHLIQVANKGDAVIKGFSKIDGALPDDH